MKLSIGQAWDDTKAVFRADGGAIFAIALALTVLPGAILETAAPSGMRNTDTHWSIALLGFVAALLSLTSQIAVSRIALGHPTTVGGALALAFRRVLALLGALVLAIVPLALVLAALSLSLGATPTTTPANLPPSVLAGLLLALLVLLFVLIRLMFLTPLAADTDLGPVALLKRTWQMTRGHFLKLFGLVVILMLVGLLLLGALGGALSAVIILAFGTIEPGNLSALLVALVQQLLAVLVSVLFIVVTCRLYLQASRGGEANVSVPHAGHSDDD
ncbi:hypothetical protein [Sphingomonas sp. LHG3443-2]|uniref:hypothetical protein n=1 Tax=Sphingomonas sp. LHG3443-2 TaxID=2804639 RepID=UPI003CFA95BF